MTLKQQIIFWIAVACHLCHFPPGLSRRSSCPSSPAWRSPTPSIPIADWFERRGMSRLAATFTILVLSIFVLGAAIVILLPILINQLIALISNIPDYVEKLRGLLTSLLNSKVMAFLGLDATSLQSSLGDLMKQGATLATSLFGSILVGGRAVLNILSLIVITPVVAFYLLYDWDRMVARIDSWLPRDYVDEIRRLAREMDATIAAFVRGQILVCVLLGDLLRRRADDGRAELRAPHRPRRRPSELHSLSRLRGRLRHLDHHRPRPVLAGLDLDRRHGRGLPHWPIDRRLCAPATPHRRARRPASGVAALRPLRLRPSVRLRRPDRGDSRLRGDRRPRPLCARTVSGEPDLSRLRRRAGGQAKRDDERPPAWATATADAAASAGDGPCRLPGRRGQRRRRSRSSTAGRRGRAPAR